jgi:hypothetical protein
MDADANTLFLSPYEAEAYVEGLQEFPLEEIGSSEWIKQHEKIEKLNLQAHQSAQAHADEYIMEACLTFDKIETLLKELLNIEGWKEFAFPKMKEAVAKNSHLKAYFCLYHECVLLNLFEVFLYHEHVCEALGESLIEIIDYCMRKIMVLLGRSKAETAYPHRLAKDIAAEISTRTDVDELDRNVTDINFKLGISAVACIRYIAEHAGKLHVGVITRLLDTHDVVISLVPLIEYPPWTHRTDEGKWKKYIGNKWESCEPENLMKLTKTEGQVWICLYWLMCDGEARKRYHFNSFRKEQVLRVRKYLNDVMLDQLPILADVQRYMDELTIMQAPPATHSKNALLMESVPVFRDRLEKRRDWADIAAKQILLFAETPDKDDGDIRRLADIYQMEGIEGVMGEKPMPKEQGELVICNFMALEIDGTEKEAAGLDMVPDKNVEEKITPTPKGDFIRQKLKIGTASEEKKKKDGTSATPLPPDGRLQVELIYTNGTRIEHSSSFLELPSLSYTCRSPAELVGKVLIDVPSDDPALPASIWRQLGSLEMDEAILQVQLVRMAQVSAKNSDSADPNVKLARSIHCYTIGTVFVSTKKIDGPDLKFAGDSSLFDTINPPLETK